MLIKDTRNCVTRVHGKMYHYYTIGLIVPHTRRDELSVWHDFIFNALHSYVESFTTSCLRPHLELVFSHCQTGINRSRNNLRFAPRHLLDWSSEQSHKTSYASFTTPRLIFELNIRQASFLYLVALMQSVTFLYPRTAALRR